MPMTIYKLFGNASGDSVSSLDIQLDGEIMSILMTAMAAGVNALDEGVLAEVSFLSSNSFTSNDTRGSLMQIQIRSGMLTSGMGNMATNMGVSSLEVPVSAGERIHMHILDIGSLSSRVCHTYLYIKDRGTARIPGRRR